MHFSTTQHLIVCFLLILHCLVCLKISLPPTRDTLIVKGYISIPEIAGHSAEHIRGMRYAQLLTGLLHL